MADRPQLLESTWVENLRWKAMTLKSPSVVNEDRKRLLAVIDRFRDALAAIAVETEGRHGDNKLDHLHDLAVEALRDR